MSIASLSAALSDASLLLLMSDDMIDQWGTDCILSRRRRSILLAFFALDKQTNRRRFFFSPFSSPNEKWPDTRKSD